MILILIYFLNLLNRAALGGHTCVCYHLMTHDISPNVQDNAGRTPLQCAAYGGFIRCMTLLLEHGADPNLQDNEVRVQSSPKYNYAIAMVVLHSGVAAGGRGQHERTCIDSSNYRKKR